MALDVVGRRIGPRDGPQVFDIFVPTAENIRWIREEAADGVTAIPVCSLIPAKLNPQFSDAPEVAQPTNAIESLDVSLVMSRLKTTNSRMRDRRQESAAEAAARRLCTRRAVPVLVRPFPERDR